MAKKATIDITVEQARMLETRGAKLRVATLYQTMGPHWREIVWIVGPRGTRRCYVCDQLSVAEIRRIMGA